MIAALPASQIGHSNRTQLHVHCLQALLAHPAGMTFGPAPFVAPLLEPLWEPLPFKYAPLPFKYAPLPFTATPFDPFRGAAAPLLLGPAPLLPLERMSRSSPRSSSAIRSDTDCGTKMLLLTHPTKAEPVGAPMRRLHPSSDSKALIGHAPRG